MNLEDDYDLTYKEKKYPIGLNGQQCIGPCYEPDTYIVHPITLEYVTSSFAFCPVHNYKYNNPDTGKTEDRVIDQCIMPSKKTEGYEKEYEMNILLPKIDFDCVQFLKIYYSIFSFDDALIWVTNNKTKPHNAILRVLECSWKAYGKDIDFIDDQLIDIYIHIIKNYWIKKIYQNLKNYITVKNNKIYFTEKSDKSGKKYKVQKINFILQKFITKNNLYKFFDQFISNNRENWENISNYNDHIKKSFIKYILNKIEKII